MLPHDFNMQDQTWTSEDGVTRDLTDLSDRHRLNIIRKLQAQAFGIQVRYLLGEIMRRCTPYGEEWAMSPSMEPSMEPIPWLMSTPLLRELVRLNTEMVK